MELFPKESFWSWVGACLAQRRVAESIPTEPCSERPIRRQTGGGLRCYTASVSPTLVTELGRKQVCVLMQAGIFTVPPSMEVHTTTTGLFLNCRNPSISGWGPFSIVLRAERMDSIHREV